MREAETRRVDGDGSVAVGVELRPQVRGERFDVAQTGDPFDDPGEYVGVRRAVLELTGAAVAAQCGEELVRVGRVAVAARAPAGRATVGLHLGCGIDVVLVVVDRDLHVEHLLHRRAVVDGAGELGYVASHGHRGIDPALVDQCSDDRAAQRLRDAHQQVPVVGREAGAVVLGHDLRSAQHEEGVGVGLFEALFEVGKLRRDRAEPREGMPGRVHRAPRDRCRGHHLAEVSEGPAVVRGLLPAVERRFTRGGVGVSGGVRAGGGRVHRASPKVWPRRVKR